MVFRKISNDLKECALELWEKGWDEEDIQEALGVSRRSLFRWRAIFREFGTVQKPPSPLRGRVRTITRHILDAMADLYHLHPDTYLDELQLWLAINHDVDISLSGIQKNLDQVGLTLKLLHKIARERDEARRAEWREMNDRTTGRRRGRALIGHRADISHPFVRGERYSLVAAISVSGYIAARALPGSVDSFSFFDFIAEEVLPNMNPWPDSRSVLIVDNCSIHHTEALADLVRNAGGCDNRSTGGSAN
ncbi:hypothetical protein BV25DRAFT_1804463 [Artomyces pyxidatus]|uniref:Uncharacterized protein n=1 Tax=Artomyces pyxidatus TaxID=48021 RepID=A0ACB8T1N6_9AGAM|nr:hypothetical protein BV25DRAFT_1804463 [Artomyces pyxidatus]